MHDEDATDEEQHDATDDELDALQIPKVFSFYIRNSWKSKFLPSWWQRETRKYNLMHSIGSEFKRQIIWKVVIVKKSWCYYLKL